MIDYIFLYILNKHFIRLRNIGFLMDYDMQNTELTGWEHSGDITRDLYDSTQSVKHKQKVSNLPRLHEKVNHQQISSRRSYQNNFSKPKMVSIGKTAPELQIKKLRTKSEYQIKMQANKISLTPLKKHMIIMIKEERETSSTQQIKEEQIKQIQANHREIKDLPQQKVRQYESQDFQERDMRFMNIFSEQNKGIFNKKMGFDVLEFGQNKNKSQNNRNIDSLTFNRLKFLAQKNPEEKNLMKLSQLQFYKKEPMYALKVVKPQSNETYIQSHRKILKYQKQQINEPNTIDRVDQMMKLSFRKKIFSSEKTKLIETMNKGAHSQKGSLEPVLNSNRLQKLLNLKAKYPISSIKYPSRYKILQN